MRETLITRKDAVGASVFVYLLTLTKLNAKISKEKESRKAHEMPELQ